MTNSSVCLFCICLASVVLSLHVNFNHDDKDRVSKFAVIHKKAEEVEHESDSRRETVTHVDRLTARLFDVV